MPCTTQINNAVKMASLVISSFLFVSCFDPNGRIANKVELNKPIKKIKPTDPKSLAIDNKKLWAANEI